MDLRDIVLKRKRYETRFAQQQIVFFGVIAEKDGTTRVPGTPDDIYVQPNGTGDIVGVLNRNVKRARVGMGVVCGFEAYSSVLEVLRVDERQIAGVVPIGYLNLPDHAESHLMDGDDPLPVYDNAIMVLLTYTLGLAGLVVNVTSYVYEANGTITVFPGQDNVSLAAHEPAAGLALWVLIYLDVATNTLMTVAGATTVDSPVYVPVPPAVPANTVPSALVRIAGGQTVVLASDIVSARDLLFGSSRARAEIGGVPPALRVVMNDYFL